MRNYVGNPLQIRGAEQYVLQNGKGDGMHFLYIRNGTLRFLEPDEAKTTAVRFTFLDNNQDFEDGF